MKLGLHSLSKIHKKINRRGRGIGGRGAKSGRGMKGQKARAGYSRRLGFEGGQTPLYQRLPKARGAGRFYKPDKNIVTISTSKFNDFAPGSIVGPGTLRSGGLGLNKATRLKLINGSKITKGITVRVHAASPAAISNIEQAGGKVEIIKRLSTGNK